MLIGMVKNVSVLVMFQYSNFLCITNKLTNAITVTTLLSLVFARNKLRNVLH
ncbi:hypothetical protein C0J52_05994 [Blattella germanica]|nr:hypothetical protein C0J52_05994 [Blattella germanica]